MKVLITDAEYKHSLALVRYIKKSNPEVILIGQLNNNKFKYFYKNRYHQVISGSLPKILDQEEFDLVIPVGTRSCREVVLHSTHNKVMPDIECMDIALDKTKTIKLAQKLGIPVPHTLYPKKSHQFELQGLTFPVVVKGKLEAGKNVLGYAQNREELSYYIKSISKDSSQQNCLPLVQEYKKGIGAGFFGFYQKGELKRFYIHRRIREYPVTGGYSTAAETFYHPQIFTYGKRILDSLKWNGVAMVEFKFDPETDSLSLMEINPKFWGSCELGLAAGINFGELVIQSFRGENIKKDYHVNSYQRLRFYWPLDGDFKAILKYKKLSMLLDYFRGGYVTNLNTNGLRINFFKGLQMAKDLIRKR